MLSIPGGVYLRGCENFLLCGSWRNDIGAVRRSDGLIAVVLVLVPLVYYHAPLSLFLHLSDDPKAVRGIQEWYLTTVKSGRLYWSVNVENKGQVSASDSSDPSSPSRTRNTSMDQWRLGLLTVYSVTRCRHPHMVFPTFC